MDQLVNIDNLFYSLVKNEKFRPRETERTNEFGVRCWHSDNNNKENTPAFEIQAKLFGGAHAENPCKMTFRRMWQRPYNFEPATVTHANFFFHRFRVDFLPVLCYQIQVFRTSSAKSADAAVMCGKRLRGSDKNQRTYNHKHTHARAHMHAHRDSDARDDNWTKLWRGCVSVDVNWNVWTKFVKLKASSVKVKTKPLNENMKKMKRKNECQ